MGDSAQVVKALRIHRNAGEDHIGRGGSTREAGKTAAAADTGKVFSESDVEVSEAIDFAEFYPFSLKTITNLKHIRSMGKGVGVVFSPWNFPIAIPCGGLVAALAAGNTVIFKPASSAVLTAWVLCQCFWEAGISKNTLQFLPCTGSTTGLTDRSHSPHRSAHGSQT